MSAETDDEWCTARIAEMKAIGVALRSFSLPPKKHATRYWQCEAIINHTVYCVERGETAREAIGKTIATVMAARLQGLKFGP